MEKENHQEEKKKGFFSKLFETLDKKLADKAKKAGSCCGPNTIQLPPSGNWGRPDCRPLKDNKSQGGSLKENKDSDGPNTDQLKHSGDWGCPNYHSGKKIESLDGDSCCG